MKVNVPLTEEDHLEADKKHAERMLSIKNFLIDVANKLDKGESLTSWETWWAVGVLKGHANSLNSKRKRPAGRPAKLPGDIIVLFIAQHLGNGVPEDVVINSFAQEYGTSTTAVKKALGKAGKGPEREIAKAEYDQFVAIWNQS
jgi:hypothetical protein